MKNFKESEFPENTKHADPLLLSKLDHQRDLLGHRMFPSPVKGALARFDYVNKPMSFYLKDKGKKPSMHHVFTDKKSTAIDVFCDCSPFEAFTKIIGSCLWHGVGVYFDTSYNGSFHVMFHLDFGRENRLLWFRDVDGYHYQWEPGFWSDLFWHFEKRFDGDFF